MLLLPADMPARAALLLLLTSLGCTATTFAQRGSPAAERWLARHDSSDVEVDYPTDRGTLTIDARSPTDIRLVASDASLVPVEKVQRLVVVRRGLGGVGGALIGVTAGLLVGVFYDLSHAVSCGEECSNQGDASMPAMLKFSALGMAVGAAAGAAIGARDVLELR